MVPVGVIGLSPAWETQYRPALKALRTRIAVRAVYDHVLSRAELAAADFGALPVAGMRALARRDDLKALLVFDTGWGGAETIRLLCSAGRPMFVAGTFSADEPELERLIESAVDCGSMVMPALGARYTPATCRLRELMASRLGRPLKIEIEADAPPDASRDPSPRIPDWDVLVSRLVDWCCYVVPTPPTNVLATRSTSGGPDSIEFTFAQPRAGGPQPHVEIRLRPVESHHPAGALGPVYRVRCERGEATLDAVDRIAWRTADERGEECLSGDRPAVQVILDHFCRRVVGGLVPVAGLDDIRRSRKLIGAIAESHRLATPVTLNGKW